MLLATMGLLYYFSKQDKPVEPRWVNATVLSHLVNAWRYDNNLTPFSKKDILCTLAASRAADIKTDWSHDKFVEREEELIYAPGSSFGENLSKWLDTEQEVLNAWLDSPKHKDNLANPKFTQTCIVCEDNYCVQEFSTSF